MWEKRGKDKGEVRKAVGGDVYHGGQTQMNCLRLHAQHL